MILGQLHRGGSPRHLADLVADAIDDRLPEVCLHRSDVARFEHIEAGEHVHRRLLNEVAGIERPPRRGGQPAVRPSLQTGEAPLEKRFHGETVAAARLDDQLDRRFVAQQGVRRQRGHARVSVGCRAFRHGLMGGRNHSAFSFVV
jgi:hypothetical protein